MQHPIQTYIEETYARLTRSRAITARFALPALTLVRQSRAYQQRDWTRLRILAHDLHTENLGTIRLARKYPDVFHPNVIRSRQVENGIYTSLITLLTRSKAA